MKKLIVLSLIILLLAGCTSQNNLSDEETENETQQQKTDPIEATAELTTQEATDKEPISTVPDLEGQTVETLIQNMSLEEKVAQLFIVDFYSYNKATEVTHMTPELETRLIDYPIGGVIFFGENIIDTAQVTELINNLQQNMYFPLFVSIDEEGGLVSRLQKNPQMGMTVMPSASVIGGTNDSENAYVVGSILGKELNALGFNMDFAPVADVNTNPDNPVIGERAFSSDPLVVGDMVVQEAKGLMDQNVVAVAKHFPGHGDTSTDTHSGAVFVEHNRQRLNEIELVPFQKAIDNNIMGIMVAHIALPNITGGDEPASLSYEIITKILREEMHFNGLVITDALNMGAVAQKYDSDEACVKALQAGVDILLMPEDFELGYKGVLKAITDGTLTQERIDESVVRILSQKMSLGLFTSDAPRQPLSVIGSLEHTDTIKAIIEEGR